MHITKYEHACLVVEDQGARLVIDPSDMARSLGELDAVAAVVFTHAHYDHFSAAQAAAIAERNPAVQFFGPEDVVKAAGGRQIIVVAAGNEMKTGAFSLRFYGGRHAPVQGKDVGQNVGVMVNDTLYYPGDSYDMPDDGRTPKVLALGVSGPWFTPGQSIAALQACAPAALCLATHDGLLDTPGTPPVASWLPAACTRQGIRLAQLQPGESIEI